MEKWLKWAIEIQSLAQAGLAYTQNVYDIERYERLREIAAEMIAEKSDISLEKVKDLFCNETGYQTPKLDTRAAIFQNNKILLTHEKNGTWALPGGWVDVLESAKSNTIKEVKEETGLDVETVKLIAVQDRNKHNRPVPAIRTFLSQNNLSGKVIKPYATNAGWLGKTFQEIKMLCPNSEVEEGMNIVFESYSDKLVTKEQEIENWINQL